MMNRNRGLIETICDVSRTSTKNHRDHTVMNKIAENTSIAKLTQLMQKNLGTNFTEIKTKSPQPPIQKQSLNTEADHQTPFSKQHTISNTRLTHQHLAAQTGITDIDYSTYKSNHLTVHQRAQRRKQIEQARKQQNIEAIMSLALDYCSENGSDQEIDPDWFHQFILLSENTSSKMMQALWGKILAGEIANPGTFSYKSLAILKRMTSKEAIAFQHACQLAMTKRQDTATQITYGFYQKPNLFNLFTLGKKNQINLSKLSLPYPELLTLMDIELIYQSEIESGEITKGETLEYNYLGKNVKFTALKKGMVINYFKFTQTGYELAKLLRLQPDLNYLKEMEQLFSQAFDVQH